MPNSGMPVHWPHEAGSLPLHTPCYHPLIKAGGRMDSEQQARETIDRLLIQAGWVIADFLKARTEKVR